MLPFLVGGTNRDIISSREAGPPYVMDITFEHSSWADVNAGFLPGPWIQEDPKKDLNVRFVDTRFANMLGVMMLLLGRDNKPALTSVQFDRMLVEDCKDPLAGFQTDWQINGIVNIGGTGPQSARIADSVFRRNVAGAGGPLRVSGDDAIGKHKTRGTAN